MHITYYTKENSGFTLIETVVVIGIFSVITCLALSTDIAGLHRYSFTDERNNLIAILYTARNEAQNNFCLGDDCLDGTEHGVHIENGEIILFQGVTYDSSNETNRIIPIDSAVTITGATDIVFEKNSGDAHTVPIGTWSVTMTDTSGHSSIVSTNSVGQITWTN